ncbi:MAG: NAD(P)H-binding protein, partial [Massilia sp.]
MTATKLALVLGATGGIGGEVASALQARGWKVRALARKVPVAPPRTIEWLKGDAMCAQDVLNAAEGVDLIVHAVNPPGYRDWEKLVLPMLENSIAAARATGARILLPGTLYNYGAGT